MKSDTRPFACPVCGMDGETDVPVETYNGMRYRFCSEQCRERFLDHPSLFIVSRRDGGRPIPKRRVLRLEAAPDDGQALRLSAMRETMMGIGSIAIAGRDLILEYDLRRVTLDQIVRRISEIGVRPSRSISERLKRAWLHEREETELAILAETKRPCCNEPPHGGG